MKKVYPLLGILGPIIYIFTVFLGVALRSDYSHLINTISELTLAGAPNLLLMSILFAIYNLCILFFGIGAFMDSSIVKNKLYKTSTIMLAVIGLLGFLMLFFPQDPRGTAATIYGTLHIALAGIVSPLTILSILLVGLSLRGIEELKTFVWYSYFSAALVLVSGALTAISISSNAVYGGLLERITILTFIIWVMVFSYIILKKTPE